RTGARREDRAGDSIIGWRFLVCLLAFAAVAEARSARADVYFFRDRSGVMHFTNAPTDSRFHVLVQDRVPRTGKLPSRNSPYRPYGYYGSSLALGAEPPADIAVMVDEAARRYQVEAALVHAVVRAESDYDHLAVSPAGARGLMQLMPGTASLVGVR